MLDKLALCAPVHPDQHLIQRMQMWQPFINHQPSYVTEKSVSKAKQLVQSPFYQSEAYLISSKVTSVISTSEVVLDLKDVKKKGFKAPSA